MNEFNLNGNQNNENTEGLVFNLSGVDDSAPAFEVLPKGTYDAIIEDIEFTNSQSSGVPMLHATFSIIGGEYEGRKISDYYLFDGKGAEFSLPRLKQLLTRVCPDVSLDAFKPQQFADSGVAINRQCQLKIAVTTQKKGDYKGEKRNNIREIMSGADVATSFLG